MSSVKSQICETWKQWWRCLPCLQPTHLSSHKEVNQGTYGPEKKEEGIPLNLVSGAVRGLEEGRCLFHAFLLLLQDQLGNRKKSLSKQPLALGSSPSFLGASFYLK